MLLYLPQNMIKKHKSAFVEINKALCEITGLDRTFYWWNQNYKDRKVGYAEVDVGFGAEVTLLSASLRGQPRYTFTRVCPSCGIPVKIGLGETQMKHPYFGPEASRVLSEDSEEFIEALTTGTCLACQKENKS